MTVAKTYKSFYGATGVIREHRDGTATLTVCIAGKKYRSKHKNPRAARAAWYRWDNWFFKSRFPKC